MFRWRDSGAFLRIEEVDLLGESVVVTGCNDQRGLCDGIDAVDTERNARDGGGNLAAETARGLAGDGEDFDAVERRCWGRVLALGNADPGEKPVVLLAFGGLQRGGIEGIDNLAPDGGNGEGLFRLLRRIRAGKGEGGEEASGASGGEDEEAGMMRMDRFHDRWWFVFFG